MCVIVLSAEELCTVSKPNTERDYVGGKVYWTIIPPAPFGGYRVFIRQIFFATRAVLKIKEYHSDIPQF